MLTIKRFASIPEGTDLTALYRSRVGDYPKFFKMDTACKLGFLLAEELADEPRFEPREDRAVLMFSTHGCLCNDRHYEETVQDFPSPALFVYTLPNIITLEPFLIPFAATRSWNFFFSPPFSESRPYT